MASELGARDDGGCTELAKPLYLQYLERALRLDHFLRQTSAIFNRNISRYVIFAIYFTKFLISIILIDFIGLKYLMIFIFDIFFCLFQIKTVNLFQRISFFCKVSSSTNFKLSCFIESAVIVNSFFNL